MEDVLILYCSLCGNLDEVGTGNLVKLERGKWEIQDKVLLFIRQI